MRAQSCPTLCDPMDCILPDSPVHGDSLGKNTGVGLPFPSPGDLPDPGIEPRFPALQADSLPSESPGKPRNKGIFLNSFYKVSLTLIPKPVKTFKKIKLLTIFHEH